MLQRNNIVILGLRGSGKTSASPLLAARLGRALVDLDDVTVAVIGTKSVPEAWSRFGKEAFRAAEAAALRAALTLGGKVVALGGGTPTAPGASELIMMARASGSVRTVYLRASAATLRQRLGTAEPFGKPSVTLENPSAAIETVLAERDPLYVKLADHVIDVDSLGVDEVVRRVAEALGAHGTMGDVEPKPAMGAVSR